MAHTIAKARGYDSSREKSVHRLGSQCAEAEANTWRTFATVCTFADGSGYLQVKRGDRTYHVRFNAEDEDLVVS